MCPQGVSALLVLGCEGSLPHLWYFMAHLFLFQGKGVEIAFVTKSVCAMHWYWAKHGCKYFLTQSYHNLVRFTQAPGPLYRCGHSGLEVK